MVVGNWASLISAPLGADRIAKACVLAWASTPMTKGSTGSFRGPPHEPRQPQERAQPRNSSTPSLTTSFTGSSSNAPSGTHRAKSVVPSSSRVPSVPPVIRAAK